MAEPGTTRFKPKPAARAKTGARVRFHPPANDNRTQRLMLLAVIVAAVVTILWMIAD
jgi:hypothetical protein